MTQLLYLMVGFAIGYFTFILCDYLNYEWPFCREWWFDEHL